MNLRKLACTGPQGVKVAIQSVDIAENRVSRFERRSIFASNACQCLHRDV